MSNIGVPSIKTAYIHPINYLPIAAVQIACWTSILYVVVSRGDTYYPSFLLLDSPRMALNSTTGIAVALYRRLHDLATALPGNMQLIVADNELPAEVERNFAELDFDYEHPTIATVSHRGPMRCRLSGEAPRSSSSYAERLHDTALLERARRLVVGGSRRDTTQGPAPQITEQPCQLVQRLPHGTDVLAGQELGAFSTSPDADLVQGRLR